MLDLRSQNYNLDSRSKDVRVRAYRFSLRIIQFLNDLPNRKAFWVIGDQLLRAATSVGANLIEAQASSSKREFIKYYEIALKSSNEVKYWLGLLKDSYGEIKSTCEELLREASEINSMLGASVLTLKGRRDSS